MASKKWITRLNEFNPTGIKLSPESVAKLLEEVYEEGKHDALHPRKPKSEGYWIAPPYKEVSKFEALLDGLVNAKFGLDYEGSCPVRVHLLDRTRYEKHYWFDVPIDFTDDQQHPYHRSRWKEEDHTEEENVARLRAICEMKLLRIRSLQANLSFAARAIERFHQDVEREFRAKDEAPEKEVAARIKHLERIKEKWENNPDPFSFYKENWYVLDRVTRTYSFPSKKEPGKTIVRPIDEKPKNFDELMDELEQLKKWKYPKALPWDEVQRIPY